MLRCSGELVYLDHGGDTQVRRAAKAKGLGGAPPEAKVSPVVKRRKEGRKEEGAVFSLTILEALWELSGSVFRGGVEPFEKKSGFLRWG